MKEETKRTIKNIVALIIMGVAFSYLFSCAMRSLTEMNNLQANVIDYKGTIDFIKATNNQNKLVVVLAVILTCAFIGSRMEFKKKKYQDASSFGIHGTSRWGTMQELKQSKAVSSDNKFSKKNVFKSLSVEDGIIVGKVPNKNELVIIPQDTSVDNRNVLVIGASGSGKGQSYVYPNLINNTTDTIIITDPKGDIFNATHQLKRDQGYEVFQIDFNNLDQSGYNPLDYVFDDLGASKVSQTIARNSAKDGKEDFFFNTAKDLLTGLIIYCKENKENANIPYDVKGEFYKISDDEDYLRNICEEIGVHHPAYAYLKDASVADGKTRTSILSSFAQQTAIFSLQKVAKMTTRSDFNFYDFQEKKSILYVKIPMKDNPVEALTATFFDQLISAFYDIADKHHGVLPLPVFMILDEFANLGKINHYDNTLSTCRGLGIGITTIIQDFGQLEGKYGKELSRTIRSNHDTHLFLATKDNETAKYYSQLAGDTTARMTTKSNSNPTGLFSKGSPSTSQQEQYVKKPLIPEGELTIKDKSDCYVFITNQYPIKLEKSYQFNIYGDFLFKNKKPNYHNFRDRYLKHLGVTINDVEETFVDNDETTEALMKQEEYNDAPIVIDAEKERDEGEFVINEAFEEVATTFETTYDSEPFETNVDSEPFVTLPIEEEVLSPVNELEDVINDFISNKIEISEETLNNVMEQRNINDSYINDSLVDEFNEQSGLDQLKEIFDFNSESYNQAELNYQNIMTDTETIEILNNDPDSFLDFENEEHLKGLNDDLELFDMGDE